jgi:hypothetical protein
LQFHDWTHTNVEGKLKKCPCKNLPQSFFLVRCYPSLAVGLKDLESSTQNREGLVRLVEKPAGFG